MRTSRLEAFSDGVLAIIITIMVLELREPHGDTFAALWHAAGTGLLSYLLSFVYVGIYWNNHHHMFQLTTRATGGVLWANLGLLFCLSLFPFTTSWVDSSNYARAPVVLFGLNLLLAAIAYFILQTVIIRDQGASSPLRTAIGRDVKGKVSPLFYIAGIVAALVGGAGTGPARPGIWIAVACYVGVAVIWVVPDRRIEDRLHDRGIPEASLLERGVPESIVPAGGVPAGGVPDGGVPGDRAPGGRAREDGAAEGGAPGDVALERDATPAEDEPDGER